MHPFILERPHDLAAALQGPMREDAIEWGHPPQWGCLSTD